MRMYYTFKYFCKKSNEGVIVIIVIIVIYSLDFILFLLFFYFKNTIDDGKSFLKFLAILVQALCLSKNRTCGVGTSVMKNIVKVSLLLRERPRSTETILSRTVFKTRQMYFSSLVLSIIHLTD